jgi:hypothetical protein
VNKRWSQPNSIRKRCTDQEDVLPISHPDTRRADSSKRDGQGIGSDELRSYL